MAKTTRPTTDHDPQLRDRVLLHLGVLQVRIHPEHIDEALSRATRERLSYLSFLDVLLGDEAGRRRERAILRRIRDAKFAETKLLEQFDWEFNKKAIDRLQIEELATAGFVERRENLVIIGWSGVGKSHLIQAVGTRVCAAGHRVSYVTSAHLIQDLGAALAEKSLPQRLRHYASQPLLIIDEFGFDRIERAEHPDAASLLYKVVDLRRGKKSTALVSNIDFKAWPEYLGDAPLTMAIIDRLVDGAVVMKIKGRSYRAHRAKKAGQPES
jgi:DNA replication protein DnaC